MKLKLSAEIWEHSNMASTLTDRAKDTSSQTKQTVEDKSFKAFHLEINLTTVSAGILSAQHINVKFDYPKQVFAITSV